MKKLLLSLLVFFPLFACAQAKSILVLSDIHLDLGMNSTAFYHVDTDSSLFKAAINKASTQQFSYIIMPGDLLSHRYNHDPSSMETTFQYIINHLEKMDKDAIILPALGNNDCELHNTPGTRTYEIFYNSMLKRLDHNGAILKTFKEGGYYNYSSGDLSVIVLNTVLFAYGDEAEAEKEIKWLQKTLHEDSILRKKVWITYHIAPGIDRYGQNEAWHLNIEKKYLATIKRYAPIVKFQLAGHTHMNDYKLIMDGNELVSYIDIAPGLDSRNGNNPAFQVVHYNEHTHVINEVTTYYTDSLSKNKWSSFSFKNFDFNFLRRFDSSSKSGKEFMVRYFTMKPVNSLPQKSRIYWDSKFFDQSTIKIK